MRPSESSEVVRIKSESLEARERARYLLQDSKRLLGEFRQTVERTYELMDKSRQLIAKAKLDRWTLSLVICQATSAAHAISLGL